MNRFYGWLGLALLLAQIPFVVIILMNDIYVGAAFVIWLFGCFIYLFSRVKKYPQEVADKADKRYKRKFN